MIFYLIYFTSATFLSSKVFNKFAIFRITALVMIILLIGLRSNVGVDYPQYYDIFSNFKNVPNYLEPGFRYIVKWFGTFGPMALSTLFASITILFVYPTLKKYSKWYSLSLFLFLIAGGYSGMINGVRQSVALSIFFYSSRFILNREFHNYLFFICIAGLFHYSAFALLPVYFIFRERATTKTYLIFFLLSLFLYFTNYHSQLIIELMLKISPWLTNRYQNLLEAERYLAQTEVRTGLGFLFRILLGFIIILHNNKITKKAEDKLFFNLYFLYLCLHLLFFNVYILMRVLIYFSWFQFLVFDRFILLYNKRSSGLVSYVFIIALTMLFIATILNPHMRMLPYKIAL